MLVLVVLIEPQVASLEIYFKKLLSRDDDSDSANFLQQIPPPAAVLGVPELTHPCIRSLGEPRPGAELPAPSAFPSRGPSGNRLPIPPAHKRRQQAQRNTSSPRTPPFDLGHCSLAALKAPDRKAGQPGTHNTAAYSNQRSFSRVSDNHRFLFFFATGIFRTLGSLHLCFANPPSNPRPRGTDRPQPGRDSEHCPHRINGIGKGL